MCLARKESDKRITATLDADMYRKLCGLAERKDESLSDVLREAVDLLIRYDNEDYYPAFVEYGHGGPAPAPMHPYIRPAFDARQDEAYGIIRDGLLDELKKTT